MKVIRSTRNSDYHSSFAQSVIQTADQGYVLTGRYVSLVASHEAWLVKTDAAGQHQWNRTYGGPTHDEAYDVVVTGDGGYALAGFTTTGWGTSYRDCWLVKTDDLGWHQWNVTYGGADRDEALSLVATADGGYALAGFTESFSVGDLDCWLVKTNATGHHEWNVTYGDVNRDQANAVVVASDGGITIAGHYGTGGAYYFNFWLIKTRVEANFDVDYGGTSYPCTLTSTSVVSDVAFYQGSKLISFTVTGTTGTAGYCSVTFPTQLLGPPYLVFVNYELVTPTATYNATHTTLAFTYTHSSHPVEIYGTTVIPELATILTPLLLVLTLVVLLAAGRLTQRRTL